MSNSVSMETNMLINFRWNCNEGIDIPEEHLEALKEDALDRINTMMKEGYNQGELHTSVRFGKDVVPEEDEDEGLTYSGWWTVIRKNKL